MKELVNASEARRIAKKAKDNFTEVAIEHAIEDVQDSMVKGKFDVTVSFTFPVYLADVKKFFVDKGYGVESDSINSRLTINWY